MEEKVLSVTIRYRSEYGESPPDKTIVGTLPLTHDDLPVLSFSQRKFIGWVYINSDGHESALSERMIVSKDWLIPINVKNNEYYVIFTAKWVNDRKSLTGDIYEGDYNVTPKVTPQSLPTAEKFMEQDVLVKSIPYYDVSNTAGGSSVYIGSEL